MLNCRRRGVMGSILGLGIKFLKVWRKNIGVVIDLRVYGTVIKKLPEPRSYLIQTNRGDYRRNRWHLIPAPHHTNKLTNSNLENGLPNYSHPASPPVLRSIRALTNKSELLKIP